MLKNKSISGDNTFKSSGESESAFPGSESTTESITGKIWISSKSPNETLRTVDENMELGVDDRYESLVSVSQYSSSLEDDDWSGDKKRSIIPKPYPFYLCPPFWFINLRGAWKHREICIANIILIGSCVYYFVILIFYSGLTTITEYLWIAPTLVIFYAERQTNETYTVQKVVSRMIKTIEQQLKIHNELVTAINTLGEEGARYRRQVVVLMDTIAQTIEANKRFAWRNRQSVKEVEQVDKYITWKKPAMTISEDEEAWTEKPRAKELPVEVVSSEIKTQGYLVESREGLISKRGDLNKRLEEEQAMLKDVKESIIMLQDYNSNSFTNEWNAMKKTVNKLQETVGKVYTQVGRLEEFKGLPNTSYDAFSDESTEYLRMLKMKRDKLRKFTFLMEMSLVRSKFKKRQSQSGQSGMTRATFNAVIKEVPTSAQRAIKNMGDAGNFDALRVKGGKVDKNTETRIFGRFRIRSGKKKVMDNKVGRKKLPGIDAAGMEDFLIGVEEQMKNDMNNPLTNLIMNDFNTEI